MRRTLRMAALAVASTLAACTGDPGAGPGPGPQQRTLFGTTSGGSTGVSPGNAGGILGGTIGADLDERDRQRAYAAEMQALERSEPGEPVGWRGGAGRYGTVVPGAYYATRGTRCRDYSHTIFVDRHPQTARGTACRNPDGSWSPAG